MVGLLGLAEINRSVETVTQRSLVKERLVNDWARNIHSGVTRTTAIAKSADASLATFFADEAAASTRNSSQLQQQIEPLIESPEEKSCGPASPNAPGLPEHARYHLQGQKDGDVATAERVFARNSCRRRGSSST